MKRRNFYILGFSALMFFDTLTQVSFKLSSSHAGIFVPQLSWLLTVFLNPWVYGAVIGYLGAFVAWMTLLKHAPVGPSFAASHLDVVTVLIISVVYLGEKLSAMQVVGAICIMIGIVFLSLSKENKNDEQDNRRD
ncbi:MAG TPA: DMT family transporter [Methylophilaceae bacterium]|jgi:drug/metabolite transporter (DMT)-like permease